jgi:hypothetical protein
MRFINLTGGARNEPRGGSAGSRSGVTKPAGPHTLRRAFVPAALDAGVPLRDVPGSRLARRPAHTGALRLRLYLAGPAGYFYRRR